MDFEQMRKRIDRKERGKREFMQYVEQHQQAWGTETYKGKPSLSQLMSAKVVAFWHPTSSKMYLTATIHNDTDEIEAYLLALVIHSQKERVPVLRLMKIFMDQQPKRIKNVNITFADE